MINLISPNICIELIATIFAYFYLRQDKSKPWRLFFPYLLLVTLAEFFARYISTFRNESNHWLYNIMLIFETAMMFFIFDRLFKKYLNNRLMIIFGLVILLFAYSYDFYQHGFLVYNGTTRDLLSLLLLLYALIYFYLFLTAKNYVVIRYYPPFWLVSGILLFYSTSTIINLSFMKLEIYVYQYPLRYVIFALLNLIFYTLWSYSFYCQYRQKKM